MKVLGISGSPRKGGNTDTLLAEMLRGAADEGAETKTIHLNNMKFVTCQHCDGCLKEGNCVIQDEMQDIYPEFEQADVIILATPIQFMGITAPMKAMIDLFQSRWARKYVLKVPPLGDERERKGFFVSVGGRKIKDLFEATTSNNNNRPSQRRNQTATRRNQTDTLKKITGKKNQNHICEAQTLTLSDINFKRHQL